MYQKTSENLHKNKLWIKEPYIKNYEVIRRKCIHTHTYIIHRVSLSFLHIFYQLLFWTIWTETMQPNGHKALRILVHWLRTKINTG